MGRCKKYEKFWKMSPLLENLANSLRVLYIGWIYRYMYMVAALTKFNTNQSIHFINSLQNISRIRSLQVLLKFSQTSSRSLQIAFCKYFYVSRFKFHYIFVPWPSYHWLILPDSVSYCRGDWWMGNGIPSPARVLITALAVIVISDNTDCWNRIFLKINIKA